MLPIRFAFAIGLILLGLCTPTWAQSLMVEATISDSTHIDVGLGEIIEIEIFADLSGYAAAGISLYVRLPASPFSIVDQGGHAKEGVRPWLPGSLFAGAMETENCLVTGREAGLSHNQQLLAYSLILGPGKNRSRSGKGVVGRFQFMSMEPIDNARIEVFSNPVHDSFLVLGDGLTERRFRGVQDLEVSAFDYPGPHTRLVGSDKDPLHGGLKSIYNVCPKGKALVGPSGWGFSRSRPVGDHLDHLSMHRPLSAL